MNDSEWRETKRRKKQQFMALQNLPYEIKIRKAELRAWEFYNEMAKKDLNCHVSVGGLDSITLLLFLRSIGIDVPAISVSMLEDKSIQRIHDQLGIIKLAPYKSKVEVLNEVGFPVISKKLAGRIETLQNPTKRNTTVRHAIITGECGEQGHYAKNSRMQLPKKWLNLFAGMENKKYGTNYKEAFFKVSNQCCYHMKEKPCGDWSRKHESYPYLGMMASEGGQREESLIDHGCNYYGKTVIRSAPFAIFTRQDLLQLTLEMDKLWKNGWRQEYEEDCRNRGLLKTGEHFTDSIVPEIYGTIERKPDGTLYTTKAQRTGCSMCGFGVHMEKRPHRFDRLRERNPKEWEFWMYRCVTDPETGEKFGWGKVLDYIGVEWEDIPIQIEQLSFII